MIHVLSAEEIDPDVQGDLRLVDCEDGDVAEVTVSRAAAEAIPADAGGLRRVGPRSSAPAAAWCICWPATKCDSDRYASGPGRCGIPAAGEALGTLVADRFSEWLSQCPTPTCSPGGSG